MSGFDLAETGHDGDPGVRRLAVRGELDLDTSPRFTEWLDQMTEDGSTLVVLECSDLEFIDGSGLRAVLTATDQLESRGGRLVLDHPSPVLCSVIELAGLSERFATRD